MKAFNFNDGTDLVIAKNKDQAIKFLETICDRDEEAKEEEVEDLSTYIVLDKIDPDTFEDLSIEEIKSKEISISDYIIKYNVTEPEHFTNEF